MSFITLKNYQQHKPDRASLSPGQRDVYDLIEDGALEFYDDGPEYSQPIDLYIAALNKRFGDGVRKGTILIPEEQPAAKAPKTGKKRLTVAQRKAAGKPAGQRVKAPFKLTGKTQRAEGLTLECAPDEETDACTVRGICNGEPLYFFLIGNPEDVDEQVQVWAVAGEDDDRENPPKVGFNKLATKRASLYGAQIIAFFEKASRTHEKNLKLVQGRAEHNRTVNAVAATKKFVAQKEVERARRQQAAQLVRDVEQGRDVVKGDRYYDSDKRRQEAKDWRDTPPPKFSVLERVTIKPAVGYVKMARQIEKAGQHGIIQGRYCDRYKSEGRYVYKWHYFVLLDGEKSSGAAGLLSEAWVVSWTADQLTLAPAATPAPAAKAAPKHPKRLTLAQRKAAGSSGAQRHKKPVKVTVEPPVEVPQPPKKGPQPPKKGPQPPKEAPKGPRTKTKKEAAPKAPKVVKVKPVDARTPVSHFDNDVLFMKDFLKLEGKAVSLDQVKKLHVKMEKNITKQHVRSTSKYAGDVAELAGLVAKTFAHMQKEQIATIGTLKFDNPVVGRVRTHVEQLRIDGAINVLSQFINMQGTVPAEKAARRLEGMLHNELSENPKGDHSLALAAAHAVLQSWKPGQVVAITKQQLGRLQGLGCPDTPAKPCGCSKKATSLNGAPAAPAPSPTAPYRGQPAAAPASAPVSADAYPEWEQEQDEHEEDEDEDGIFSAIGQKDTRRAQGETLPLPGPLGQFIGEIERHEYLMALRGDKGAGKSRLQYQVLNLFAGMGLKGALFSLEIDKNSDIVRRYTEAYIAPGNRANVKIASEAPGGLAAIKAAAKVFDVVAIDSWTKVPGTTPEDVDKLRKEFPRTLFIVIFQSTTGGTARGGSMVEYDASAVCQVNLPGLAVMEKNRYAKGAADALQWDVNAQKLIGA